MSVCAQLRARGTVYHKVLIVLYTVLELRKAINSDLLAAVSGRFRLNCLVAFSAAPQLILQCSYNSHIKY